VLSVQRIPPEAFREVYGIGVLRGPSTATPLQPNTLVQEGTGWDELPSQTRDGSPIPIDPGAFESSGSSSAPPSTGHHSSKIVCPAGGALPHRVQERLRNDLMRSGG
jgi:hypothetical protein